MIPILLTTTAWLVATVGWSDMVSMAQRRLFAVTTAHAPVASLHVVGALAIIATIANLVNFVAPVSSSLSAAVLLIGWLVFAGVRRKRPAQPHAGMVVAACTAWLLLVVTLVNVPLLKPYDAGLYHLPAMAWMAENRLPFGLANLHGRLGFNSLWFSFGSIIDLPALSVSSARYFSMSAIVIYFLGLEAARELVSALKNGFRNLEMHSLFTMLLLPIFMTSGTVQGNLGSTSPDLPVVCLYLLAIALSLSPARQDPGIVLCGLLLLSAVAVMVKFSAAPIVLLPILLFVAVPEIRAAARSRRCLAFGALVALLVTVWMVRGLIQSGCLFYPVAFTCFPALPWSVPVDQARMESLWIMSWARHSGPHPDEVLSSWSWFPDWLQGAIRLRDFWMPVALTAGASAICAVNWRESSSLLKRPQVWSGVVTSAFGIAYWFVTAPDVRFGAAYLWALALQLMTVSVIALRPRFDRWWSARARAVRSACVLAGVLALTAPLMFLGRIRLATNLQPERDFNSAVSAIPVVEVASRVTTDGSAIIVPVTGYQCWLSPLPCTPYFDADLRVARDGLGEYLAFSNGNHVLTR